MQNGGRWWLQPWEVISGISRRPSAAVRTACYRFGDSFLEIDSTYSPVFDALRLWYGECAISDPLPAGTSRIRCSVRSLDDPPLILVSFRGLDDPRHEAAAPGVFQHLSRAKYPVVDGSVSGWRLTYSSERAARPFLATRGFDSLLDLREEPGGPPPGFLLSHIVSAVIGLQRDVLFVHAASVGIHGTGVLLMGHGGAGKTTLSLALATRGHAFLGDNQACVRIRSRELLPFPRSASIKPGPRARAVDELLNQHPHETTVLPDGRTVILMRIPPPEVGALPLGGFFYLRRIGDRPILERFKPAMTDGTFLARVGSDPMAVFGVSPSRRLMGVMVLMEMLSEVPCHFLDAGAPEETAALIERTMEAS